MFGPAQARAELQRQDIIRLGSALAAIARRSPRSKPATGKGNHPPVACKQVTPHSPWTRRKLPLYNF